ncbi:hypothetical protein METP2_01593 [Methanosarcinales archaeon]|nr:hypothetical protein METP2_01593 [Methanosarcinales archaeon]
MEVRIYSNYLYPLISTFILCSFIRAPILATTIIIFVQDIPMDARERACVAVTGIPRKNCPWPVYSDFRIIPYYFHLNCVIGYTSLLHPSTANRAMIAAWCPEIISEPHTLIEGISFFVFSLIIFAISLRIKSQDTFSEIFLKISCCMRPF